MTLTRSFALLVTVATAGALLSASEKPASEKSNASSAGTGVRLKTISARVGSKGASLVIETSEPVSYVAMRPDPLTVLLDFRNVVAEGAVSSVAADVKSPIAGVSIEAADSLGAPASRVRIALVQPVAHRVRSDRNRVVVEFDKLSATAAPYLSPPASRAAPDAMMALRQTAEMPTLDPIAALGLSGRSALAPQQPPAPPAPPPVPTPPEQLGSWRGEKKYIGNPVSLDFQGADLRAVLRTFAEISGLNIVIDPTVQGTVDVALRDVPWDQALDIILRANKLGYIIDGTIVRIAPLAVLADEQAQQRKLSDEQALAGTLTVLPKRLSYAKAEDLQAMLTKSVLSQRGTVQIDARTNTLIITDLADRLTAASDLIASLDLPQPQVEIEARIVQTNKTYARALGVQWGFNGNVSPALGNTTNLAFPNNGSLGSRAAGGTVGAAPEAVNLGVAGATSAVGLALGSVNGAFNLDMALSALESSGNGRLLSTPRVTTQNNVEAEIAQGVQIPYQTVANNTVTVNFKDAALILKVTPQITAANTVIMKISVDNGSVGAIFRDIPSINTQRANTTLQVSDGQTTVIGGIYASNETNTNDRTPGLSRIPLLKWLFKRDALDEKSSELLIFITPRIIKG